MNSPQFIGNAGIQTSLSCLVAGMALLVSQQTSRASEFKRNSGGIFLPVGSDIARVIFPQFDEFPDVPLDPMGLPADWRNHPLWKP
jgi:hypothetical protein